MPLCGTIAARGDILVPPPFGGRRPVRDSARPPVSDIGEPGVRDRPNWVSDFSEMRSLGRDRPPDASSRVVERRPATPGVRPKIAMKLAMPEKIPHPHCAKETIREAACPLGPAPVFLSPDGKIQGRSGANEVTRFAIR